MDCDDHDLSKLLLGMNPWPWAFQKERARASMNQELRLLARLAAKWQVVITKATPTQKRTIKYGHHAQYWREPWMKIRWNKHTCCKDQIQCRATFSKKLSCIGALQIPCRGRLGTACSHPISAQHRSLFLFSCVFRFEFIAMHARSVGLIVYHYMIHCLACWWRRLTELGTKHSPGTISNLSFIQLFDVFRILQAP